MPYQILFDNIEEAVEKVKQKAHAIEECRVKNNKDNIKIKVRTKRTLYTLVLTPENTGTSSIDEVKGMVDSILEKIGCPKRVDIE
jgi:hypothetical protein